MKTQFINTSYLIIFLCLGATIHSTFSQWAVIGHVSTNQLNSVKFFDQNNGIAVGAGGIWRTTNGGFNWIKSIDYTNLNSISFLDTYTGFAVGDSGGIFETMNRGMEWIQKTSPIINNFNGVSFLEEYTAYVGCIVGDQGKIIRSSDDGNNWYVVQYQPPNYYDLYCVKMIGSPFNYAAGSFNREWMIGSIDEGVNWGMNFNNPGYPALRSIDYIGPYKVIFVGDEGWIRYSSDGGLNSWTFPNSQTSENLNCVTFSSATILYCCGNNGTIIKSTDGGLNWSFSTSNVTNNLKSLSFINSSTGWCVGSNGIILHTTNGGLTPIITFKETIPKSFKIYQNYPNPFNPTTCIKFDVPYSSNVAITVFDILGRKIQTLINENKEAGMYEITFDGANYASGMYFYKIKTEFFQDTKEMIILK